MAVVLDFETRSLCDLKKSGAYRYWEDLTTEIICLNYEIDELTMGRWFPGQPMPADLEAARVAKKFFVAHNAQFEKQGWRQQLVALYGWPNVPNSQWHCTQARAAQLMLPQALDKLGKVLKLTTEKDMVGNRLTLSLSRVNKQGYLPEITPVIRERVSAYCDTDVREQSELHRRIGWMPADEREVWLLDQRINERGLRLDVPLVRAMDKIVQEGSKPLAEEFRRITGGLNMTQIAKVGGWMLDQGVYLPDMKKETLAAVLGETEDGEEVDADERIDVALPPHVERALRIRQLIGSASVKKLTAMRACVCSDGRARGLLSYHAAGTGRWGGRIIQPQNFPRGTLRVDGEPLAPGMIGALVDALMTGDHEYVAAVYGPPVETVVSSLRHTIVAGPGRVLVAGDYAGIEARITLALAGAHDKTALMASGADVYCDMASQIFKRPINKKADPEERQIGKNSVLGLGFGMGWRKFQARYAKDRPEEFVQGVVDTYRKEWAPEVPDLWRGLEHAACRAVWDRKPQEAYGIVYRLVDRWLEARFPDGSVMMYESPRPTRRAMPWDETDIRPGWSFEAEKQGRRVTVYAFGGLLTENAAQHMARQLLVGSMKTCEKENIPIVLSVHDENVGEPEYANDVERKLQQIMEDVPSWAKAIRVPVAVETWQGDRYRK